jgi:hypothetical protein
MSSITQKCSVTGCDRESKTRGWCAMHYMRWGRHGDPLYESQPKVCSIEGCENRYIAKGYCQKHYRRLERKGDPLYIKPTKLCSIEGCSRKHFGRGYCSMHWKRLWKNGDPYITKQDKHGLSNTPEHGIWKDMIKRCTNSNCKSYKNYGGRGIRVCDRWLHSFVAFYEDMGKRPSSKYTLDRTDNNGNYEPSNCRWVVGIVQHNNKRTNVWLTANGITMTVTQWARYTGLPYSTIKGRLKLGWPTDKVLGY